VAFTRVLRARHLRLVPDAYSNWVYVSPGTSSSIGVGCGAPWSTGVGGVAIEYGG
jgi:hypothetical protein